MKFSIKAPINRTSLGQVAYNVLKQFFLMGEMPAIFPIGQIDLGVYSVDRQFAEWLNFCINQRYSLVDNEKTLQIWHLKDSEHKVAKKQLLLSFHETDSATDVESKICSMSDVVAFSSQFSKDVFSKNSGNIEYIPLGFDPDFHEISDKEYLGDDVIHFGLIGKFEKRKNHEKILKSWVKMFGNNRKYQLTCLISNQFRNDSDVMNAIKNAFGGKFVSNVNILPFVSTNSLLNDTMNSFDIDLSGLSSAEGWGLPAFNATCLGKWSVATNYSGHKSWANKDNSILVEPDGVEEIYDDVFFFKGRHFSQGNMAHLSNDKIEAAIEESIKFAKTKNVKGIELGKKFTYKNTAENILKIMGKM